jgi:MFS family permease
VSLRHAAIGFSLLAFTGYGLAGWTPPFFNRVHGEPLGRVGVVVGTTAAFAGLLGVTLGGWLADRLRQSLPEGRLVLGMAVALLPIPLALWMLGTSDVRVAYAVNAPLTMLTAMWIGAGASTVQDLVLPRMRSVAAAFYILVVTFVGLALGPYTIGRLSDMLDGDLPRAMGWALAANAFAVLFLARALAHLRRDEASLRERARAAGEPLG